MLISSSMMFNCKMLIMLLKSMNHSTKPFTLSNKSLKLNLIPHLSTQNQTHLLASGISRHNTNHICRRYFYIYTFPTLMNSNTFSAKLKSRIHKKICSNNAIKSICNKYKPEIRLFI